MENEEIEYRELISTLKNSPDELQTLVRIFEIKKKKLMKTLENSSDKDQLWDARTRLMFVEEFKREIITHSKPSVR